MEFPENFRGRSNSLTSKQISSDFKKAIITQNKHAVSPLIQVSNREPEPTYRTERSPSIASETEMFKDFASLERYKQLQRYNSRRESLPVGLESSVAGLSSVSSCSSLLKLSKLCDKNSNMIYRPGQANCTQHEFKTHLDNTWGFNQSNKEVSCNEKPRHASEILASEIDKEKLKSEEHRRHSSEGSRLCRTSEYDSSKSYQETIMKKYLNHDPYKLEYITDNEMKDFSRRGTSSETQQRSFFANSLIGTAVLLKSASDKITSPFVTSTAEHKHERMSAVTNQKSARISEREMNAWSPTSL